MSMDDCFPSKSVPRWAQAWSQLGRCMWNGRAGPCAIGSMRSRGIPHAFAKRDATWDALVGLQLFDHNFHRTHQALRLPAGDGVHRYHQRSPAMALGLTDHLWSFQDLLTSRIPITS